MSSEEQVDPQLIEQTKRQIRAIVAEVAQLAKSEASEEEFYDALLNKVVAALAAVGGAVWTFNEQGHLQISYQINLQETGLADNPQGQIQHGQLLRKAVDKARATGEGVLAAPHSGGANEDEAGNPTNFLLVLGPLKSDQEIQGLIEIFQRPNNQPHVQKGYLNFLMQMCELAGDFLKTRSLRSYADRQSLWSQLEQFTRTAHSSLDPRDAAFTIANEGRRLIQCDRVSVALRKGTKYKVEAVSGQDVFDSRSNVINLLGKLSTAVGRSGDPVWYTGDSENLPPQVEQAVQEYVDEAHSKMVAVLPLKVPSKGPDEMGREQAGDVVGALVVEQIEKASVDPSVVSRVEIVADHASSAISNAVEHHRVFLLPLWKKIGKLSWLVQAQTLPKTITVAALILAGLLAMMLVPADFNLHGDGTLQSQVRREIFAPIDGMVLEVGVEEGELVEANQDLFELETTNYQAEIERVQGELDSVIAQLAGKQAARYAEDATRFQRDTVIGEIRGLQKQQESLIKQLALYQEEYDKRVVESPIKGQVATWQKLEDFVRRPVNRGDKLMEISDPAGELEIEVLMPEDHMGHINRRERWRKNRIAELENSGASTEELADLKQGLRVEYILATHPELKLQGRVTEINPRAEVRGEEGATVLMRVAIDRNDLPQVQEGDLPQLGGGVTARVYCGKRAIGYVWFHDLLAFFNRTWFKLF